MNRRSFLQMSGLAGLALMAPQFGGSNAHAGTKRYEGPFFISLNAGGGWDPTSFCDPKGGDAKDPKAVNHFYTPDDIGHAGPDKMPYAPLVYKVDNDKSTIFDSKAFWEANATRVRVINGFDMTTNNHDAGSRYMWSGQLTEGMPSLAAMIAAGVVSKQYLPLAFLSNGGYDATQGIVALTRVGDSNALAAIAHPNLMDPGNKDSASYHSNQTYQRILATQNARLQSMRDKQRLPVLQRAMNQLFLARQGDDGLAALADEFEQAKFDDVSDLPGLQNVQQVPGQLRGLMQQAQVAMLAFKAGVAVSANLSAGGFDTHSNHDRDQGASLGEILRAFDYIMSKLDALGLADKTYIVVGSDFGRTPYYNNGDGKDHWNVSSALVAGPGIKGRVIGATDDAFKAKAVDPTSLGEDPNGVRIEPKHLHLQLRKTFGIDKGEFAQQFPLAAEDLPLLA
jgi:hypothetical protein